MATYLIINLIVLAVLVPVILHHHRIPRTTWWFALIMLIILTGIFDNLIVALMIVGYDPSKTLGIRIGVAPIEDFFYALVAMIIVPTLWNRGGESE